MTTFEKCLVVLITIALVAVLWIFYRSVESSGVCPALTPSLVHTVSHLKGNK